MTRKRQFPNLYMFKLMPRFSPEKRLPSKVLQSIAPLLHNGTPDLIGFRSFCAGRASEAQPVRYHNPRGLRVVKAQAALTDYLNSTRGIYYTDAEHMSKNSPIFLGKLLRKVEDEEETDRAVTRFLRYHPINEFELFFESIGLKPSDFNPFLPQDLLFLSDEEDLLNNYHDLCNYGIARKKIGRIYKEAREVFKYVPGLLKSKLLAYEQLGLSKSTVIKVVASSPTLLLGDVNKQFIQVLKELEKIGLPLDWIGGYLSERNTYNWGEMLVLLPFFHDVGFADDEFGTLLGKHPGFLLDGSGKAIFSIISLLLKMGAAKNHIFVFLSEFPRIQVGSFAHNLWRAFQFVVEIEMDSEDIKKLILSHTKTLGSFSLKKPTSLCTYLHVGTKRLCRLVIEDPQVLQKYALGLKVLPLPSSGHDLKSLEEKKKFLYRYGFAENSMEMKRALSLFRGKGDELQERFDFLVNFGLDPNQVFQMLKKAPAILNQTIEVMKVKLEFILHTMGYPLSSVVTFPHSIIYTTQRIKLRHLMYHWLVERGKATPGLALASIVACSEKMFMKKFVNHHPDGPKVWIIIKNSSSG